MPVITLGQSPVASDRLARPLSPAVRAGDFVFVSGTVPTDDQGQVVPGGIEAQTRDRLPVIGASPGAPGLFHAFGFSGHGFQLGPGVGDTMAELIATGETDIPLHDFRIQRFAAAAGARSSAVA